MDKDSTDRSLRLPSIALAIHWWYIKMLRRLNGEERLKLTCNIVNDSIRRDVLEFENQSIIATI